ncbi:PEGA domain-containing protein [Myxococcota bacterium]|nr:PEGA domain-containing protein [Myxococcota bacterium]
MRGRPLRPRLRAVPPRAAPRSSLPALAGAIALFALSSPSVARATTPELQATGVFAVARDPTGQKAAAVADALLRNRVAKSRALKLIEPARVLSGDPRTREEETLERARAAFTDGRRAYDSLNLDEAIARLGQAVNLYQQTGPLLGDVEELKNALQYLGAALTLRGSADEGESTFVELLTIDPQVQLDGFPPAVAKTFEGAAARIDKAATGSVEVFSTPPYAAVYVDGRFEGVTPLTLTDLVAGTHYLRIEKVGYTVHGAPLEVSPNQKITSQTRLRDMKRGVEVRDLGARSTEEVIANGMGGSLRSLARLLTADTLIFVAVSQSGNDATFTGGVFDASTGSRLTTERAVISATSATFGQELDGFVGRLVKAAERGQGEAATTSDPGGGSLDGAFGLKPGSGTGATGTGGTATTPGYSGSVSPTLGTGVGTQPSQVQPTNPEVYLGWTLIGLGGASIITGAIFGGLALDAHADFKKTDQLSPDLKGLQDLGKRNALVGDICMGAGAVTAIGGTIILLIANRAGPTPEELVRAPRTAFIPVDGGGILTFEGVLP